MKWRAWKAAYETAVDEWQLEVERLQAVIARLGAERDEAVRISVGLIEGMHPIEREVALEVLAPARRRPTRASRRRARRSTESARSDGTTMSTEPPGAWVYTEQERVRADTAEELNKRYSEALERIAKGALGRNRSPAKP